MLKSKSFINDLEVLENIDLDSYEENQKRLSDKINILGGAVPGLWTTYGCYSAVDGYYYGPINGYYASDATVNCAYYYSSIIPSWDTVYAV